MKRPAERDALEIGWPWAAALIAALSLVACPGGSDSKKSSPDTTCVREGQSCVFQEGKIGTCVQRTEPCDGAPCYVCQSQH